MSPIPNVPRVQATGHFLSGILGAPRGDPMVKEGHFRRYAATARTTGTLQGNSESRVVRIQYEVGRVHHRIADALRPALPDAARYDAMYDTSTDLREDFIGLARKFSNFSSVFEVTNLAGVVERLGKALGAASLFPNLESSHLRGGAELVIHTLGTADTPITALTNAVFIPRLVESQLNQNIFSILANAVAGEGSSVATDVVELDAASKRPLITSVSGDAFVAAVVGALRILGANMIACDRGALFGYALTRGLHSVLTVVGHTDEGGYMRDVFRHGAFSPPFGGIHSGLEVYTGLPALQTTSANAVAAYCDSILLTTAAGVAFADPCVELRGSIFPFFSDGTTAALPEKVPGEHQDGAENMVRVHIAHINSVMDQFGLEYGRVLERIFSCAGGASAVSRHLSACAVSLPHTCRHLKHASVTPFFWIEPTSLLPAGFCGDRARKAGSCSLADVGRDTEHPLFEQAAVYGSADANSSPLIVQLRSARTTPFLFHWLNHELNGLSCVRVHQMDPNAIVQPGGRGQDGTIAGRVQAGYSLDRFLWKRGQSPFPAPGEFINLNSNVGLFVRHVSIDDDGLPTLEHVPNTNELLSGKVVVTVSRPSGIAVAASNVWDAQVARARTRASRELSAANARYALYGRADHGAMPISFSTPSFGGTPRVDDPLSAGAAVNAPTESRVDKRVEPGPVEDSVEHGDRAAEVKAVPHFEAVRAPALGQGGASGRGGGAATEKEPSTARDSSVPSAPASDVQPQVEGEHAH